MKNNILIPGLLFAFVAVFAVVSLSGERFQTEPHTQSVASTITAVTSTITDSDIVLFYGDGCPHCAIIEEFVKDNDIEAKVSFEKKEVYYSKQNADDLVAKASLCGIPTDTIGVPFLWDGSKCLVGDRDIIEFFRLKVQVQ
ncbi:MAG: glutathione S-transferase N-terminal domain-containing protein [Candidatus Paceibacterota bacterium]|jgi:glutaredoxin